MRNIHLASPDWRIAAMSNRIAHTTLENGTEVSTVDAGGMLVRNPETCIFYPDGSSNVVATYHSASAAFTGHHRIVEDLQRKLYAKSVHDRALDAAKRQGW